MTLRRVLRGIAVGLFAVASITMAAGSASAGGPTSVLVVNPATETAAALYHADADYDRLRLALEPDRSADAASRTGLVEGPGSPSTLNLSWMIHDVNLWRVDRVVVHDDGAVSVRTYEEGWETGAGIDWDDPKDWYSAVDPATVIDVFDGLGLLEKPADSLADNREPDAAAASGSGGRASIGWPIGAAALVGGVALGVAVRPTLALWRRRRDVGPRQQLVDLN